MAVNQRQQRPRKPAALRPGQRPERPQLRNWFATGRDAWLVLEPHSIGSLAGVAAAVLLLVIQLFRQLYGAELELTRVLLWALLTFVVTYGVVGVFIWYLLAVIERELPQTPQQTRSAHLTTADTGRTAPTEEEET